MMPFRFFVGAEVIVRAHTVRPYTTLPVVRRRGGPWASRQICTDPGGRGKPRPCSKLSVVCLLAPPLAGELAARRAD